MKKSANLLLITFDQWRGDWGSTYTPILDLEGLASLGNSGFTAERCYTTSPHCVPARLSWLTGLEPSQIGVTKNEQVDVKQDSPSIIRELQKKGWHTAIVGKTHWTNHGKVCDLRESKKTIEMLGFNEVHEIAGPRALRRITCELTDEWEKEGVKDRHLQDLEQRYSGGLTKNAWTPKITELPNHLYPDIWIANKSIEVIKNLPISKPWLLWISFVGPHEPFDTPYPWHGINDGKKLPRSIKRQIWIAKLKDTCELKALATKWENKLDKKIIGLIREDYADRLYLLDSQVKKIVNAVKQRKDYKNTAINLTSDHGELLGDSGILYKGAFLEGAIRVPWIYRQPEMHDKNSNPQKLYTEAISSTNLLKKVLLNLDNGGLANDIWKLIKNNKGAVSEFGEERVFIRRGLKLAVDKYGEPIWAINLTTDPDETTNVVSEKHLSWLISPKWVKMRRWAKKESQRRNSQECLKQHIAITQ